MSFDITTAFVQQYKSNIMTLAQQKGSRLRSAVRVESQQGKDAFYDRIGATTAHKRTSRHGDTPLISTAHTRRKVTLVDYDWADLIDDLDKVKILNDPTSAYAQNAAYAMGRAMDQEIITALGGAAYGGVDGTSSVTFISDCRIIQGDGTLATAGSDASDTTETGLSTIKLTTAKYLLDKAEVDASIPRYFVCKAVQLQQLLNDTKAQNADYNTIRALVRGEIDTWLGFKFIQTELLGTHATDTGCDECFAFAGGAEGGIVLAVGQDMRGEITQRADKNYATQVYASMSIGSTRLEGAKVVKVLCKNSVSTS